MVGKKNPDVVVAGFDRPEIRLEVEHHADAHAKDRAVLDRTVTEVEAGRGPGIVYSATRKGTEEIAEALAERGLRVRPYHAGLKKTDREDAQNAWMDDELDVVVVAEARAPAEPARARHVDGQPRAAAARRARPGEPRDRGRLGRLLPGEPEPDVEDDECRCDALCAASASPRGRQYREHARRSGTRPR